MRKRSTLRTRFVALPCLSLAASVLGAQAARGSETPLIASSELSNDLLDRARVDVARIQTLVGDGNLPKTSLEEAEAQLADVKDESTLNDTLYGPGKLADQTAGEQARMLAAAERRFERQAAVVAEREKLFQAGAISRSEIFSAETELETRRHVLELARNRIRLIETQRQAAQEEQMLERALESGTSHKAMLKFEGCGRFSQRDFDDIAGEFEQQFHYPLPVTARGQTRLHHSLGLDHHGKIDVGLNPEEPEGIWLRRLLENRQIPYIAFRAAVRGAATAPHIHLGTGSARLTGWLKR